MLIFLVHFTEEPMDHARFEAIKALFSDGAEPVQAHVEELKKNPRLLADEENDLLDEGIDVFNNFKAFSNNAAAYIATLKASRQKSFLQRLMGLPEDPVPEQNGNPVHDVHATNPPPAQKVAGLVLGNLNNLVLDEDTPQQVQAELPKTSSPTEAENPRHIALRHLFHPTSKEFSQADVDVIGQSWRLKKEDAKFLSADVRGQIALFTTQVDDGDNEGYVDGIDEVTRPDLTDEEREKLKQLLRQLLKQPKTEQEAKPTASVNDIPKNVNPVGDPITLNFDVPPWIRALHATERWQKMRPIVEQIFARSRSSDPSERADGQKRLEAWKQHVRECSEGCSGPELVGYGERMRRCIRELEGGADPTSHVYYMFYIKT